MVLEEKDVPALASFFDGTAAADGGKTGNQAVVAATLLAASLGGRGSLLVLHGLLALRRTVVLTLGSILSLGRTIALDDCALALRSRKRGMRLLLDHGDGCERAALAYGLRVLRVTALLTLVVFLARHCIKKLSVLWRRWQRWQRMRARWRG